MNGCLELSFKERWSIEDAIVGRKSDALWNLVDLNHHATGYACHYGFRRPIWVCGLDFLFPLRARRQVSTRSSNIEASLGIGLWLSPFSVPRICRVLL